MSAATTDSAVSEVAAGSEALPSVTVTTGTRSERARERSPGSVEVIGREQIERSGATDLGGVLRGESSLFVSPDGTQASIRGARREDNVILIDGRRVAGEPSGRYELNRIPTGNIERIEVVKGPGSVLYGADALGGVINVITRDPEPGFHGDIDLQAGARTEDAEAERYNAALGLHGGSLDTRFRLDAQAMSRAAYSETATAAPDGRAGVSSGDLKNYDVQERYTIDEDRRDEADVYTLAGTLEHFFSDDLRVSLQADYLREDRERNYINTGPTQLDDGGRGAVENIPARWLDDNERIGLSAAADWQATETLNLFFRSYRSVYEKERVVTSEPWTDLGYPTGERPEERDRDVTLTDWRQELIASWTPDPGHTLQLGAEHRDHEYEDHQLAGGSETRWDAAVFAQHE
ncbi:TonB-dependent receptor plug domain-containing protein [Halorhodospira halophila]|uniref:TonB-dependent receptor plug domain-containing protein n=1 Tax=Halorhodospira halophila TaxID=1053 RepID=UPI0002E51AFE|nr:TonB-dependent receptor plug domain-containing protein [Halorhodospira halophila]